MPAINVVFFRERRGSSPVLDWLVELRRTDPKGYSKCNAAIARLALLGYELRRPEADFLRNGIYELRVRLGSVNYRILYFFFGQQATVLLHALTKEAAIPNVELNRALARKAAFTANPTEHTLIERIDHA